jgi:tetratricopeptide (TPR) repeat protein
MIASLPPGSEETQAVLELGLAAFAARDLDAAHRAFERAHRRDPRQPLAMSWYGVTLVLVERNISLGVSLCDEALRAGGLDADLLLNQARVHLALHQRGRAVRAIARGLAAWPDHPGLRAARLALGSRRAPVVPFLARDNPVNQLLGRLRHRGWHPRDPGPPPLSPLALGAPDEPAAPHRRS